MSNAECRLKKFLSDLKHLAIHHSAFDTPHFTEVPLRPLLCSPETILFPQNESDVFLKVAIAGLCHRPHREQPLSLRGPEKAASTA